MKKNENTFHEEPKTGYMIVISNGFGIQAIKFTTDNQEVNRIIRENVAKGRSVNVSSREIEASDQ